MKGDGRGMKPSITEKQKVAALLGYAMTNYPLPLLAKKVGMKYSMLVKFLYVDIGVKDKQKHQWTADDDAKIKTRYEYGRCWDARELADEIGVSYTALISRVRTLRKIGKL